MKQMKQESKEMCNQSTLKLERKILSALKNLSPLVDNPLPVHVVLNKMSDSGFTFILYVCSDLGTISTIQVVTTL